METNIFITPIIDIIIPGDSMHDNSDQQISGEDIESKDK